MNRGSLGQARWGVWGSMGLVETHTSGMWRGKPAQSPLWRGSRGVHLGKKRCDRRGPALPIGVSTGRGSCHGGWERWAPQCCRGKVCGRGSQWQCGQAGCPACSLSAVDLEWLLGADRKHWVSLTPFLPDCLPSELPNVLSLLVPQVATCTVLLQTGTRTC